ILGYQYARGESTRNETITGHYGIHRYYLAANASYIVSWDDFALLTSGGLLWGQSFEGAYTESDGTEVGSRRASIGSTRILVQPSYLVELDGESGLFAEPYLIGEYSRDFAQTEISGHNNDPDAFRVGMGFNLFSGENLSGNLEGTTMLGREDQREINILGTVRYGF
ncbi:MAG: autotransporter domain-containing protein, partial [Pseudomonadota bacterium]